MNTQVMEVIKYMETHDSITQFEAMRELGCMRLASRISDIRRMGYPIRREMIEVVARNGRKTRVAKYTLLEKKDA